MIAKRIGVLLVTVTMVASGAYVLVYLQRWEWNRALIAGTFMLASEMILVAAALASRIRAVERKVTAAVDRTQQERVLRRLREAPAAPRDHFAWLRPTGTSVFVPVLMGAGLVLSGLAWLVERVAKATAGSAMERGLATRLVGFSVPDEPLVEPDTDPLALGAHAILLRPQSGERAMKRVLIGLLLAGLTVALVIELADVTQNRHDTDRHDGTSTIVLSVSTKRGFDTELATHSLWAACQTTVLANRLASLTRQADGEHLTLAVQPALGEHAQRRLVGCLEDATVDLVSAHVVSVSS